MINNYISQILKILFVLLFLVSKSNFANSEIIKQIEIYGNERLAKQTIILFSELSINDDINSEKLNEAFI